jgi:hypothetical protein
MMAKADKYAKRNLGGPSTRRKAAHKTGAERAVAREIKAKEASKKP